MKRVALDASAVMTFFENRPGADKVEDLIHLGVAGKRQLLMSVVNWGEVYYSTWRAHGPGVARKILEDINQLPIEIIEADVDLTRAAALAAQRKASLATSDQDFAAVEKKIEILWTTA
jgi:PIN domain nuclease of toxin-antitoxin system